MAISTSEMKPCSGIVAVSKKPSPLYWMGSCPMSEEKPYGKSGGGTRGILCERDKDLKGPMEFKWRGKDGGIIGRRPDNKSTMEKPEAEV